jgi:hypothetical protein
MRRAYSQWLAVLFAAGVVPLLCLADGGASDNRQLLEQWRKDPAHAERLKRNLAYFQHLSPEAQDRLRKLDRDLGDEIPGMRARLKGVLERYNAWLDALPEDQRKSIEDAPDRKTRLERVRALRMQQWVKRLPKAHREQLARAGEKERPELVQKWSRDDLEQRLDWLAAQRNWEAAHRAVRPPTRINQLPKEVQVYYEKSLKPLLTREQEKQLAEADDKWPRFLRVLVELSDSHPLSVLGPIGPTKVEQLPVNVHKVLKEKQRERLEQAEGKWPEFMVVLREELRKPGERRLIEMTRFTPSHPRDFAPAVQQFIEKRLLPALTEDEKKALAREEGSWPAYPRRLVELARRHNLVVPSEPALPASLAIDWDRYRFRSLTGETR